MTAGKFIESFASHLSNKELGEMSGYHYSNIWRWREDMSDIKYACLRDITQACGYRITLEKIETKPNGIKL